MFKKSHLAVAAAAVVLSFSLDASADSFAPRKTLRAFASEQELQALFQKWSEEHKRRVGERRYSDQFSGALTQSAPMSAAPAAKAEAGASESVTNVQHAGVDEGGIVKLHGDYLVVLRRGRLFTVRVGGGDLKPVSSIDAFGPGVDPSGTWYDEMLMSGNTIAVIGYSYARGGTEIGLFDISSDGGLAYRDTYHLRSNDYYSSRNYASRLIGGKLVFYTPLYMNPWSQPHAAFPAMRKWRMGATAEEFKRIAPATRIYRTDEPLDPYQGLALHSVTVCDLAKRELACEASAVLGPAGRVFYVSPGSVYVWNVRSGVFRIPLDGGAPSALKATGSPIDQFSFLEGQDGYLNVLLRADGRGEAMWGSEQVPGGSLALFRVPLSSFSDGRDSAPKDAYRRLPAAGGYALQNRFVGDYLLYGAGAGWRRPQATPESLLYAVRYAGEPVTFALPLAHGVDRIEQMGANAVAVGSSGRDLHFTSLRLAGHAAPAGNFVRKDASQGETRSHGFFYKPTDGADGIVGLPIIGGGQGSSRHLRHESASLLYLRNEKLNFISLGTLDSRPASVNDACRASCVDWYGNSRPLFLRNRVFALMGYEIVEGRLGRGGIDEIGRISFAPRSHDY
jgi:hypothetical protein